MSSAATEDDVGLYSPAFPEGWQPYVLHSVAEWLNGMAFRDSQFSQLGIPIIKIAEIKNGLSGQTKYTSTAYDECYRIRPGHLLFSWSGQPETSIDAFWWPGPEGWLNQHVFKVTSDPTICSQHFLYYLLKYLKPNFIGIASNKQTTGLGHVTKADLKRLQIRIPDSDGQAAIVAVLKPLDDKVEQNREIVRKLEEMARAVFKAWFVDFQPVNAKVAGAAAFPGMPATAFATLPDRFSDSEIGPMPEGWTTTSLYSTAQYINGASFKDSHFCEPAAGLPVIKIGELKGGITAQTKYSARTDLDPKYRIDTGDILFSWSGSPDTSIDTFIWTKGPGLLNQHIFRVIPPADRDKYFVYYLLKHLKRDLIEIARNKQTTGLGHVTVAEMRRLMVCHPDNHCLNAFAEVAGPLFKLTFETMLESGKLAALRDYLLPRLLSGKLRAKEVLNG